jgi:hypothetical protein
MKKISTALVDIIKRNNFLIFGLQENLLNLSKTASYLKPLIETRVKKEIKESAVLMGLSRLNRDKTFKSSRLKVDKASSAINFTIKTNLCSYTYFNTSSLRQQLNDFYPALRGQKTYFTQSQGISEYSITIDEAQADLVEKHIKEKPKNARCGLISFDVQLHDDSYNQVGVISDILLQIAFQGISIHEVSSTYTELIFCVDQKDLKITVDTLCAFNSAKG